MNTIVVKVAVNTTIYALDKPYDYRVPDDMTVEPGQRVLVPFGRGNRTMEAMVLAVTDKTEHEILKSVIQVLDVTPVVDKHGLRLALWMNDRFYCTVYEALRAMLPIGLWYRQSETVSLRMPFVPDTAYTLVAHDKALTQGVELLAQSKGNVPLDTWQSVMGTKWQRTLQTLIELGLAQRDTKAKRRHQGKTEKVAYLAQSSEEVQTIVDGLPRSSAARRDILNLLLMVEAAPVSEILNFTQASPSTFTKLVRDGMVAVEVQEIPLPPEAEIIVPVEIQLNSIQETAYHGIHSLLEQQQPACSLLFGVTGSGKTSVFIKLLQDVVENGGQAIVLVPEIALTPQLIATFSAYFGKHVAVLHSALGVGERVTAWRSIREGQMSVVVGTRSAVFAPLPGLRLIIIDEEQETTYKSENTPRYHARDVAKFRCVQHNALLLLASATPSIESAYGAAKGAYPRFDLPFRYNESALPAVEMADMRHELRGGNASTISTLLREEIQANLDRGEQSILFLNRRGFHRIITCIDCGEVRQCPSCTVSLTYHAHNQRMMCHYCGYSVPRETRCNACGGELQFFGAGTQKVVDDLNALFPEVEVLRMDTDTTGYKGAHETMFQRFAAEKIPLMVGTQMVAKGLNFENVTLVGVVSADMSLFVNDFRANERTFNLITQVVGRAGRGGRKGRAVIQTFSPAHPLLLLAAEQDYQSFYESEIRLREQQGYPPFGDMIMLNCFGNDQEVLLRACLNLRGIIDRGIKAANLPVRAVGPAPATVPKINNRYRYHITLCGTPDLATRRFVGTILRTFSKEKINKGVVLYADLHPNGF